MAAPRKYPGELRERAIRTAVDLRRDPQTRTGLCAGSVSSSRTNLETLRNWVTQAEVDAGDRAGTTTDEARRMVELERENRELRRANEILRTASAFFAAAELDRRLRCSSPSLRPTVTSTGLVVEGTGPDLPDLYRGRNPDRPEHLLRSEDSTVVGASRQRCCHDDGDQTGARGELRGLRHPQGPC